MMRGLGLVVLATAALGMRATSLLAQDGVEFVRTFLLVGATYVQDPADLQAVVGLVLRRGREGSGAAHELGMRTEYGIAPWLQASVSGDGESGARGVSGPWLGLASGISRDIGRLAVTASAEWRLPSAARPWARELAVVGARTLGPGQLHLGVVWVAEAGAGERGAVEAAFIARTGGQGGRWHPLLEVSVPWDGGEAVTVTPGVVVHAGAGFQVGIGMPISSDTGPGMALVVTQEVSLARQRGQGAL